ncbi:aspartyl/asparaginyl beta-hydroxylase domain-containing protein [Aquimarina sp. 2201CG5-10]|uniref:aspartyl/asparaginyl beta-hydroxylase domain-containing protein n=1 Tax=Aquimarina callyspongiae TaxID=3098150 RepID=UPI002AB42DE9|nr:aspartyl/asparaginyl beta-hydroxylase domain-containing protein [Aquimarina sp. 2201CG5-10]MDY8137434.1 aspartyl/asparaginyl beta-hydroxylase domain-containing protein [Aquimarina sp. 2201CG5-10]
MIQSATTTQHNDRIKLPFSFDVEKMSKEYEALKLKKFEYYSVLPLRAPAHIVDPSLPFPPPAGDYADGSWTEWSDTPELKDSPYLMSIVDMFREHTKVTLVRLLRLAPGAVVKEHTDPTLALEIERSVIRLTIPVLKNDSVEFFLNGIPVPMQPGECWYLKLIDPHKIHNLGDTERVNLTIDMIPNDWVKKMIEDSQLIK